MNCPIDNHNPEMLVAYASGELDAQTTAALDRHLADCLACRSLAGDQAAVWNALDAWDTPTISSDFNRRLYGRIHNEVHLSWWERLTRPLRPMRLRHALPLTASAALLLIAGVLLERPNITVPAEPRAETVRAEQVEKTLDDLELLRQFAAPSSAESTHSDAM